MPTIAVVDSLFCYIIVETLEFKDSMWRKIRFWLIELIEVKPYK